MRLLSLFAIIATLLFIGEAQATLSRYRIVSSYKITNNVERFNLPDGNTIGTMFCAEEPETKQIMIVDGRLADDGVNYFFPSYDACLKAKTEVKLKLLNKKCVVYLTTDSETKAAKFLVSQCD